MTLKDLLRDQLTDAYDGRPDMSLLAALEGITDAEAAWNPPDRVAGIAPSIDQIVRHVAWAKASFCAEGFARPMPVTDPDTSDSGDSPGLDPDFLCGAGWARATHPGITGAIRLLDRAHAGLMDCLTGCSNDALLRPIPTFHGRTSAARFFRVMAQHDAYHAGTIRTRRTIFSARA